MALVSTSKWGSFTRVLGSAARSWRRLSRLARRSARRSRKRCVKPAMLASLLASRDGIRPPSPRQGASRPTSITAPAPHRGRSTDRSCAILRRNFQRIFVREDFSCCRHPDFFAVPPPVTLSHGAFSPARARGRAASTGRAERGARSRDSGTGSREARPWLIIRREMCGGGLYACRGVGKGTAPSRAPSGCSSRCARTCSNGEWGPVGPVSVCTSSPARSPRCKRGSR